jgi:hypothetical protein
MNEQRFWSMIEDARKAVDGSAEARGKLARGELSEDDASGLALTGFARPSSRSTTR